MKLLLSLALFMSICNNASSQKPIIDTTCNCTSIIEKVSYYWKLDSLANNGFRLYAYKELLNCKVDKVYRGLLLDRLGQPNKIWKTNKGTEYVYYYFDIAAMPKGYDAPLACWYISFNFGEYDKYLSSIEKGSLDR